MGRGDGEGVVRSLACVPAYNEEGSIAKIVIGAQRHVDRVIVCDDGSSDMTGEIADRLGAEVITHSRNLGYGAAIRTLFARARELGVDWMVTLDADGQHSPDDIPRLVSELERDEVDVVIGSRFLGGEGEMPGMRARGIGALTDVARRLGNLDVSDAQSGLRVYSGRVLDRVVPSEMGMGVSTEVLMKVVEDGFGVGEIPVSVAYEGLETSTHGPVYHFADVLASTLKHYSIRHPLLFYGVPAVGFLLAGLVFGLWALQIFLAENLLATNLALIAVSSTIAGLVLATTAIILFTIVNLVRSGR